MDSTSKRMNKPPGVVNKPIRLWSRNRVDTIGAVVGMLLGIVITCLNLVYFNAYMITVGPVLTVACLLYLLLHHRLSLAQSRLEASKRFLVIVSTIFWISFAFSIWSLHIEMLHRPLIYFILTAIAASMIATQILYCRQRRTTYLILFEIFLVSLSVSASAYWVFPSPPGIDAWIHREYIRVFVEHGGIPDMPVGEAEYYFSFPIAHFSAVAAKLVGGIGYKAAMFFGMSLPTIMSSLFVFLIARGLASTRVGLLAMLMFSLGSYFLVYAIAPTPSGIGFALFVMIVYLLTRYGGYIRVSFAFLLLMLMIVLVLTHTVSAFVMFTFMLSFLIGIYVYRFLNKERAASEVSAVTPALVGMFGIMMLSYWIYVAYVGDEPFFNKVVNELYYESVTEVGFGKHELLSMSQPGQVVNIIGFLILLFFGVLGCLLWLCRDQLGKTKIGVIATLIVLLGMPLGLAAFGIEAVVPDRWFAFSFVVLAVVAALAMLTVSSQFSSRWLGNMLLVCVVFVGTFFMISNKISNWDSPVYTPELNRRLVYTNAEQALGEKVMDVYDGTIITDLDYGISVIQTYIAGKWSAVTRPTGRYYVMEYGMSDEEKLNSGIVLWRDVMVERPVRVPPVTVVLGNDFQRALDRSHRLVYANSDGKAYLAR